MGGSEKGASVSQDSRDAKQWSSPQGVQTFTSKVNTTWMHWMTEGAGERRRRIRNQLLLPRAIKSLNVYDFIGIGTLLLLQQFAGFMIHTHLEINLWHSSGGTLSYSSRSQFSNFLFCSLCSGSKGKVNRVCKLRTKALLMGWEETLSHPTIDYGESLSSAGLAFLVNCDAMHFCKRHS